MSEKMVLVAFIMIAAGAAMTDYCIGLIHGTVYGWLAAGISLFLFGIGIGCILWGEK